MEKAEVIKRDIRNSIRATRMSSVKCKCGCRVTYKHFNKYSWAACPKCGARVEKPKDEFKNKLESILKGSEKYG